MSTPDIRWAREPGRSDLSNLIRRAIENPDLNSSLETLSQLTKKSERINHYSIEGATEIGRALSQGRHELIPYLGELGCRLYVDDNRLTAQTTWAKLGAALALGNWPDVETLFPDILMRTEARENMIYIISGNLETESPNMEIHLNRIAKLNHSDILKNCLNVKRNLYLLSSILDRYSTTEIPDKIFKKCEFFVNLGWLDLELAYIELNQEPTQHLAGRIASLSEKIISKNTALANPKHLKKANVRL